LRRSESRNVPERWIRPACALLLAGAWILDLLTPQLFVAAILLNAPIALSSLALDYRFTRILVIIALVANASAGYVNGLADHDHWDGIAVGDRIISALSFLLVGGLSIATQRSAARAGELTARQERAARERGVRRGIENIRASVNPELIERAIVREARESLGAEAARLYVFTPTLDEPTTYASNGDDVEVTNARPPAALSSLLHRLAEAHEGITPIVATDALGRLLLDTLGAPYAVAAPLVEHATVFGVLLVMRETTPFEEHFDEGLTYYADQAAIALAQARLFVQLAERNDELGAANVALRERSDIIRDIVYALSHDLRTPLSAARMTMRQALDGAYGELPPAYREILERSVASNEELERLAETLLLVSRYESGEQSIRREPVHLAGLVREVVAELEPLWRAKHVRVTFVADAIANEIATAGDARELRRALINLVANALTWTPSQHAIDIRLWDDDRGAHVAVDDDGFGVPEAERAHLFARVRRTPSRQGAGSGLGLYLVRRIAESHGGTIVYAPRPTGGSTFELTLPREPVHVRV
jgi:signal transduction histidine kinase